MNYNDDNEYYRYTKLFRFKHPTIQDRYIRKQRHTKGNLFLLLPLFIFSLSLLPVTVQFRILRGELGIFWLIHTYLYLLAIALLFGRIIFDGVFYESIVTMEYSKRVYYFQLREHLNIFFLFCHTTTICMSMILRSLRYCKDETFIIDLNFCNNSPGIPMDSFAISLLLAVIYQYGFPVRYFYTFLSQLIHVTALIVILYNTTNMHSWPMNVVGLMMLFGVVFLQHYIESTNFNSFILEDKIQNYRDGSTHDHYQQLKLNNFSNRFEENISYSEQTQSGTLYFHNQSTMPTTVSMNTKNNYDAPRERCDDSSTISSTLSSDLM